ncbi:MAG: PAS domain S-box protein, partial [Acidimicrobiales bacterium]
MMDIAAPLGERADGARTLVVCLPGDLDRLVQLAGLGPGELVAAGSLDEAFPAVCRERFAAVLFALRLSGEALATAVGELRIVRQGPAVVVVCEAADGPAVLARGASDFVPRAGLTAPALRAALRDGTTPGPRVRRLVGHIVHLRGVVDTLLEGVMICSTSDRVLYVNQRAADLLGAPVDDLLFRPFPAGALELADEDGRPLGQDELASATALRTGRPVELSVQRMRRLDGEVRWVEVFASLLADKPGDPPYAVVACFRDVTEEREAHAAHLAAERRRRQLLEHASDGYLLLDRDLAVREASPSIERFWPVDRITGADAATLFHPADETKARRAFVAAGARRQTTRHLELRLGSRGPDERWVEATLTGDLEGAVVVNLSEVTARVRAERARRFAEERFRLGFEHGTAGMTITDLEGSILEVNPALCELLGMPPERLVGTMVADLVHPEDAAERLARRERLFAGEIDRYRSERRYLRADGSTVWCLLNVSLIRDDDRRPLYLFSQFQDITERKSHEAALEHRVHHDALT